MQPRAIIVAVIVSFGVGCTNPFAPRLLDQPITGGGLSDQRTPDGVFQNFRIAYQTKDTLTYGKLLAPSFTFLYRNYDRGVDLSWGRDEEMICNKRAVSGSPEPRPCVERRCSLRRRFAHLRHRTRLCADDYVFADGHCPRARSRQPALGRVRSDDPWQIAVWRDESNY